MVISSVWSSGTSSQIKIPVVFIQSLPYILTVVVSGRFCWQGDPS
jgi:simple sugar transport system permease protein